MHDIESPQTGDQAIEAEIIVTGRTAPRVTPDDIEAAISEEHYFTAANGVMGKHDVPLPALSIRAAEALTLLTFCVLVLRNGFTVTGESACASPKNFDAALGRKIARQKAVDAMGPLMGYHLKEQLFQRTQPAQAPE